MEARATAASAAPSPSTLAEVMAAATIAAASPAAAITTNWNLSHRSAAGALPDERGLAQASS